MLAAEPDHPRARFLRARAFRLSGQHAAAVGDYTAALKQYPRDGAVYALRAACYDALGDRAEADRAQPLQHETNPSDLNNLAWRLASRQSDRAAAEEGLRFARKAVEAAPGNCASCGL